MAVTSMDLLRRLRVHAWIVLLASALLACSTSGAPGGSSSSIPTQRSTPAPGASVSTLPPGVVDVIDTTFRASGILAAEGLLWAEDHAQTSTVYAVDPQTGETVGSIPLLRPCDVAAADGSIWAADLEAGKLLEIDPETFKITNEVSGLSGPCGVVSVAGSLWMVVDSGIARVDPKNRTASVTDLGGGFFPGVGTPLWAAAFGSGELARIDVDTGDAVVRIPPPGGPSEVIGLAVGFGSLWASHETAGRVFRLDPESGAVEAEIDVAGPSRLLITDDSVWLSSYATGKVIRIDPDTNEVVYRAFLRGNINGITLGFGSVWVSDTANGMLYRLEPQATGIFE